MRIQIILDLWCGLSEENNGRQESQNPRLGLLDEACPGDKLTCQDLNPYKEKKKEAIKYEFKLSVDVIKVMY